MMVAMRRLMVMCGLVLGGCASLGADPAENALNYEAAAVVLAETEKLKGVGAAILREEPLLGLAAASVSRAQMERLARESTNCGPYRHLSASPASAGAAIDEAFTVLLKNRELNLPIGSQTDLAAVDCADPNPDIVAVLNAMTAQSVWDDANAFSTAYQSRLHTLSDPNAHVRDLIAELGAIANAAGRSVELEALGPGPHGPAFGTQQLSMRARIAGAVRPTEYVVLGAHLDSVSDSEVAPGANDNASGAAVVLAAYRALLASPPTSPARTVDFIWYAAEEIAPGRTLGLIGSEFVAKKYKWTDRHDVFGVLNFDMAMNRRAEEGAIAIEPDFTNHQLREYLSALNCAYVAAKVLDYPCGYPCSDHASWHAEYFAAAHVTETAKYEDVHKEADRMDGDLSAEQGLVFARLAAAFVLEFANTTWRPAIVRH